MQPPTEVFFIRQNNSSPDFYHPAVSTQLMTKHALKMKLRSAGSNLSFKIMRAEVGDWEDVTEDFVNV